MARLGPVWTKIKQFDGLSRKGETAAPDILTARHLRFRTTQVRVDAAALFSRTMEFSKFAVKDGIVPRWRLKFSPGSGLVATL